MPVKKLKFNKEKLVFKEEKVSVKDVLKKIAYLLLISLLLSLVYYFVSALLFNSKMESELGAETEAIKAEYKELSSKLDQLESIVGNLQDREKEIYYALFQSSPNNFYSTSDSINFDFLDSLKYSEIVSYSSAKLRSLYSEVEQNKSILSSFDTLFVNSKQEFLDKIPSIIPIKDFTLIQTGSSIGDKINPFYKSVYEHKGLDILSAEGVEVIAAADGKVVDVSKSQKGGGNRISLEHDGGYITNYCHLQIMLVRKGGTVKKGDVIARVGNTGNSFAPHLHYEVIFNDKVMNPIDFFFQDLNPKDYRKMMVIAINTGQALD